MIHAILQVTRGLVRPLTTGATIGAVIAAVFVGLLPAEALLGLTGPIVGFWFKERSDRRKTGEYHITEV